MTHTADKLSPFLATSAALHVGLFALAVFGPALFPRQTEASWGTRTVKGITVGVASTLPGIPLPSPPVVQDTAKPNDSKTLHPADVQSKAPPKTPTKPAEVKIPERGAKSRPEPKGPQVAKADIPPTAAPATNAIPGAGGQIPLPYGSAAGTGQATFGGDGTFGTRFPEYVTAMTTAIKSHWQQPVSLTRSASQRVYVTFTIIRRGGSAVATDIRIDQESGSAPLDSSARRAVMSADLPPLPRDYSGSSVDVRFYFDYTR